jgi:hypothetical protein
MEAVNSLMEDSPSLLATHDAATRILLALFPPFLPQAFAVMFAKPFPRFSAVLNAYGELVHRCVHVCAIAEHAAVTSWTTRWLMGPSSIVNATLDDGTVATHQAVRVEKCKYLERCGCVCVVYDTAQTLSSRTLTCQMYFYLRPYL